MCLGETRKKRLRVSLWVTRGIGPGALHEAPVVAKNELLELLHHRLGKLAELKLRDSLRILRTLADHHAGNPQRLGQRRVDVDLQKSREACRGRRGTRPLQPMRAEPRRLRGRQRRAAGGELRREPQEDVELVLKPLQLV